MVFEKFELGPRTKNLLVTRLFQNEFQLSLDKQSRWGSPLGYMQGRCITVLRQDMSQTPSGGVGTVNFCGIGYHEDQAANLKSIFLNWIWLSLDKQSRWGSPRGHTKRWCSLHLEVDRSQTTYWRVGTVNFGRIWYQQDLAAKLKSHFLN